MIPPTSSDMRIFDTDGVRQIVFSRADKGNAITHAMYAAIADALADADDNADVRAVVFHADGPIFTAGNDMNDFLNSPPELNGQDDRPPVERFLALLNEGQTPLLAAVDGAAVGVGLTMLLHCDLVYASPRATFKAPFVDLALVPEAGSSALLPALLGRGRAAEVFLLGETMSAQDAYQTGLATRLFAPEDLLDETLARARAIAAKAPRAVRETRRLMRGDIAAVRARMTEEGRLFSAHLKSEEFREAATAFLEKRPPNFARFL